MKHSTVVEQAMAAIARAAMEDPKGFRAALDEGVMSNHDGATLAAMAESFEVVQACGYAQAIIEIGAKVTRCARAFFDMQERDLAMEFTKLSERLNAMYEAKIAQPRVAEVFDRAARELAAEEARTVQVKRSVSKDAN